MNVSGQQSAVFDGIGRWLLAFRGSRTALLSLHVELEQVAGTGTTNATTGVRILQSASRLSDNKMSVYVLGSV